jgi:hypothetical protein
MTGAYDEAHHFEQGHVGVTLHRLDFEDLVQRIVAGDELGHVHFLEFIQD